MRHGDQAHPQLRLIWDRAKDALRGADEVVFVGYSMPDADNDLKYWLRRTLNRRPKPKITVVDYKQPDAERPTLEQERYTRNFGADIAYHTGGFDDYVDNVMEG